MRFLLALLIMLSATPAVALPLQDSGTWGLANPDPYHRGQPALLTVKGTTDNKVYVLEADPTTGALPVSGSVVVVPTTPLGYTYSDSVRQDYVTSPQLITDGWVTIIASTAAIIESMQIFDSCGYTGELGTGAPGLETRILLMTPGGFADAVNIHIPAGTRLSIRQIAGNCTVGELDITGMH